MRYPKLRERVQIGGVDVNLRVAIVLCVTTVVTTVYYYHSLFLYSWLRPFGLERFGANAMGTAHSQFLLFLIVPLLVVLLMGDSPADYGFRIGRWKEGLLWVAVICPLILIMLFVVVPRSDLKRMYRSMYYSDSAPSQGRVLKADPEETTGAMAAVTKQAKMLYSTGVLLLAWEYLLRGFCLFGLARVLGPGPAIFIQMVPFALLHLGKAEVETMTTWLSGVGFGFVAWRTQSFLYVFLIHWFMLAATVLIAVGAPG